MIVGIDLAGSEKRNTGFCFLKNKKAITKILHKDEEIIENVKKLKPKIVAIDAPLSLPKGRKDINEKGPHFRKCDLELKKFKIKFFPITLGPMRKLTERGIKLKNIFLKNNFKVIEVFPGAVYDMVKVNRKDVSEIKKFLSNFFELEEKNYTLDELDAITCCLIAKFYLENKYIEIGDKEEGTIILPAFKFNNK
jgi:predicted nuclease with RNAse H fold